VVTQKRDVCPICGGNGKQTAEDVMPLWVRKATLSLVPIDASEYPPRMTLRICRDCNSQMAARYEDKASTVLAPMMANKPTTLSTRQQSIIGRWFIKTTLLMNLADQLKRGGVILEDRDALRRMNQDGAVREGISIRIGRYSSIEGDPDGTLAQLELVVPGGYPASTAYYSATTLGFVAFEMIICNPNSAIEFTSRLAGNQRLVPIWPPALAPVAWPPAETLTREDLAAMRNELTRVAGSAGYRRFFQPPQATS